MKGKKRVGIELNSNIVAGTLSVVFVALEIMGIFLAIMSNVSSVGLIDVLFLIGFSYTTYKTLIKYEKLTKWEWVAWIILFLIFSFTFFVGFVIGFISAFISGIGSSLS
jgi:hypothetical protein